jgi:DGQHR domain-containing protein
MTDDGLRLPALEVTQAPRVTMYLLAVDGKRLGQFTTVARARRGGPGDQLLGYQRPWIHRHIEQIRSYLDSPGALLPNALTVAFDDRVRFEPLDTPAPVSYARFGVLLIPACDGLAEHERPGWLVDGQQRAEAIARTARSSLPVAVAAFIDADPARQREQFLRVNATRPLPRSLLHELLPHTAGPLPAALERRRLPAVLAERLNYDPASPLHLMIRTVTNPDGVITDTSILRALDNSIGFGALVPYSGPAEPGPDLAGMLKTIGHFWAAVRDVFPSAWGLPPRKSRLMHGAGVVTLGFLMDAIATGREWPPPSVQIFTDGLRLIAPLCRWTGGTWEFGRGWNHIQNTGQDARLLSDYLTSRYLDLAGRRHRGGPGRGDPAPGAPTAPAA